MTIDQGGGLFQDKARDGMDDGASYLFLQGQDGLVSIGAKDFAMALPPPNGGTHLDCGDGGGLPLTGLHLPDQPRQIAWPRLIDEELRQGT